jgi:hypothetical protein
LTGRFNNALFAIARRDHHHQALISRAFIFVEPAGAPRYLNVFDVLLRVAAATDSGRTGARTAHGCFERLIQLGEANSFRFRFTQQAILVPQLGFDEVGASPAPRT